MLNENILAVDIHKHLGVALSCDGTWHNHIHFIKTKAWQKISFMRKIKYTLDRKSLETIYIRFIRPNLE